MFKLKLEEIDPDKIESHKGKIAVAEEKESNKDDNTHYGYIDFHFPKGDWGVSPESGGFLSGNNIKKIHVLSLPASSVEHIKLMREKVINAFRDEKKAGEGSGHKVLLEEVDLGVDLMSGFEKLWPEDSEDSIKDKKELGRFLKETANTSLSALKSEFRNVKEAYDSFREFVYIWVEEL